LTNTGMYWTGAKKNSINNNKEDGNMKTKLIGSLESGNKKYLIAPMIDNVRCAVRSSTWDRYVARCRAEGETPVNPEEEGIIITQA
jgi:hypothetical protein